MKPDPERGSSISDHRIDSLKYGLHNAIAPGQVKRKSLGRHDTRTLAEIFPQHMPRPVKSGLDCFLSDIQARCSLCPANPFDGAEHEDQSITVRERGDRALKRRPQLAVVRLPLWIWYPCPHAVHNIQVRVQTRLDASSPPAAANTSEGFVYRDFRQPSRELRRARKLIEMLIGANVCLLHHVFGLRIIPQNREGNAVQPLVVPAHEDLVQGGIPGANPLDDFLVGNAVPGGTIQNRYRRY
jgi:hypothetical protein